MAGTSSPISPIRTNPFDCTLFGNGLFGNGLFGDGLFGYELNELEEWLSEDDLFGDPLSQARTIQSINQAASQVFSTSFQTSSDNSPESFSEQAPMVSMPALLQKVDVSPAPEHSQLESSEEEGPYNTSSEQVPMIPTPALPQKVDVSPAPEVSEEERPYNTRRQKPKYDVRDLLDSSQGTWHSPQEDDPSSPTLSNGLSLRPPRTKKIWDKEERDKIQEIFETFCDGKKINLDGLREYYKEEGYRIFQRSFDAIVTRLYDILNDPGINSREGNTKRSWKKEEISALQEIVKGIDLEKDGYRKELRGRIEKYVKNQNNVFSERTVEQILSKASKILSSAESESEEECSTEKKQNVKKKWSKEEINNINKILDPDKLGVERGYLRKVWLAEREKFPGRTLKAFVRVCARNANPNLKHDPLSEDQKNRAFECYQRIMDGSTTPKRGIYIEISRELGLPDNKIRYAILDRLKQNNLT